MPSSISSSNQRLPRLRWARLLGGALAIALAFVGLMEFRLALRGFRTTAVDSEATWIRERQRASELGSKALILVGASRMQLDADLGVLRQRTGLEPVQLAIDGTGFIPVLQDLAADPTIKGTVLVDFADHLLVDPNPPVPPWLLAFERDRTRGGIPDFQTAERWLADAWHAHLRSYADGAQPIATLLVRIVPKRPTPQYLVTLPGRERVADYSKVEMPGFYYARVQRNLGLEVRASPGLTWGMLDARLAQRIARLTPLTGALPIYERHTAELAAASAALAARGGRVYFLMLPKSGWVRAIDDRRYPRAQFWDRFAATVGAPTFHFEDVAGWRTLDCPDGSHLDGRDRGAFTDSLVDALGLAAGAAPR